MLRRLGGSEMCIRDSHRVNIIFENEVDCLFILAAIAIMTATVADLVCFFTFAPFVVATCCAGTFKEALAQSN